MQEMLIERRIPALPLPRNGEIAPSIPERRKCGLHPRGRVGRTGGNLLHEGGIPDVLGIHTHGSDVNARIGELRCIGGLHSHGF
jgi:hypothetical protein